MNESKMLAEFRSKFQADELILARTPATQVICISTASELYSVINFEGLRVQQTILVAELKGFAALASELAKRVEEIGITPERIRSAARTHIANAITAAQVSSSSTPIQSMRIGGDTWYFTFSTVREAAAFGAGFLASILDLAMTGGLYYLKPSLAMNCGTPRLSGDSFLDDESIAAYRAADKGEPFCLALLPPAEAEVPADLSGYISKETRNGTPSTELDWRRYAAQQTLSSATAALHISALLTDSEVVHFASNLEVVRQITIQQQSAQVIRVFGGAIPCEEDDYREYAQAAVRLIRTKNVECVVQNYFSPRASASNYAWLRACERLARERPKNFAYSAYILPDDAVRPIAYHLYDDTTFLFLRRYNEIRDAVSMAGFILIRNASPYLTPIP